MSDKPTWGLDDEEMSLAVEGDTGRYIADSTQCEIVARAQLKKVYEEGNKPCPHGTLAADTSPASKFECPICLAELGKEVGE